MNGICRAYRKPALPQLAAQPSAAVRQRTTLLPDAAFRGDNFWSAVGMGVALDDDDGNEPHSRRRFW